MGHKKFDKHKEGGYWTNYFDRDKQFYGKIKEHIAKSISSGDTKGIDIGAGPGIGALLIADLKFETGLIGFEPSETSFDGKRLSEEFLNKGILVDYTSKHGGILDIETPEMDSLDYVLILRASHEIADSLGGKKDFFNELKRILNGLKKSGVLIIAEPQYSEEKTPEHIIKKVQGYQKEHIGHFHIPSDYITFDEMESQIEKFDLVLTEKTILPNNNLLNYLNESGLNLDKSPCSFYVQTFVK